MAPRISVVTPAYNDARRIGDAIRSVRAQTFTAWEMIVVDDGSTDGTAAAAAAAGAGDDRIRILSKSNGGICSARNAGLAIARGRYVHFLDSDDWIEPTCLDRLHAALDAAPDAALVACSHRAADDDKRLLETTRTPALPDPQAAFARTCAFPVHAALTRIDLVRAVGGFDETLPACEDWDLWARIAATGLPFLTLPDPLAIYRRRPGSMSRDARRMAHGLCRVIPRGFGPERRFEMIDALMSALFYCWGGAIAQGLAVDGFWTDAPDIEGWSFDAAIIAQGVIAGMDYAVGGAAPDLGARWRAAQGRASASLNDLAVRIGRARDCLLLQDELEARLCGTAPSRPDGVRVILADLGDGRRAPIEAPAGFDAGPRAKAAAEREAPSRGASDWIDAARAPLSTLRQIASRQPARPSRAAVLEAIRAAAARRRAARHHPIAPAALGDRGKGGARLRLPVLHADAGPIAHALGLVEALDAQGWTAAGLGDWIAAMNAGVAPRGAAYALTLDAALAPEADPAWLQLCAAGARPLIFLAISDGALATPGWTLDGIQKLAANGARFGWSCPRTAPDWEADARLARACAGAHTLLSQMTHASAPIAALAPGGGARFLLERLREAGFVGALGLAPGTTHLDDPAFDLRRMRIDLAAPVARLAAIVTAD